MRHRPLQFITVSNRDADAIQWNSLKSENYAEHLLELSEASSLKSSTSSPLLETVVNLVPEAKATSTTIGLVTFGLSSHVETVHAQYARD